MEEGGCVEGGGAAVLCVSRGDAIRGNGAVSGGGERGERRERRERGERVEVREVREGAEGGEEGEGIREKKRRDREKKEGDRNGKEQLKPLQKRVLDNQILLTLECSNARCFGCYNSSFGFTSVTSRRCSQPRWGKD